MMACRFCGAPSWVTKTRDLPSTTLRYRKCYQCGRRIRTLEVVLTEHVMAILIDAGVRVPEPK